MNKKKLIIIISSVLAGVALAAAAVLIILSIIKNYEPKDDYTSSAVSIPVSVSSEIPEVSSEAEVSSEPVDNGKELVITSPTSTVSNVTEPIFTFSGTADPEQPLTVNGNAVELTTEGFFSFTVELNTGNNVFTFEHKGKQYVYTIKYRFVVMNYFSPSKKQSYSSGSTFSVALYARKGSTASAHFNGSTIALVEQPPETEGELFVPFVGSFQLPSDNLTDLNLGVITYTATFEGKSESFKSSSITCLKPEIVVEYDPNATPLGGRYVNVGSGKIAEIIDYQAETFNPMSTDDKSRPTNNYLPAGTVDYSSQQYYYHSDERQYALLRCGYQVYLNRKDKPGNKPVAVIKEYAGTLPDHNEVTLAEFTDTGRHSVLKLNVNWKAPFYFDILPQSYLNPAKQDYQITRVEYNYIDITFCYATVFGGELPDLSAHPLFSSCQLIQNQSDYTLRLFLRKQGGFYGWDSYYNEQGQLVFEFLNPVKIASAENLAGAVVLLDVGHGGIDPGAISIGKTYESYHNLDLAFKIKAQLEALGATVHMTRTTDVTSTTDNKMIMLEQIKPDLCVAIHHNSNNSSRPNGFDSRYFNAYSQKAARYIYNHTANTGIYDKSVLGWLVYFMCRSTACPVVLTENGFLSNEKDYQNVASPEVSNAKATAIVKGIVEYFVSIQ